jgi:acetyl-CoA carboxylase biotin carboxyl carrier protein
MAEVAVISELHATVWKIELAVGAAVAEDDVIMILESMKMEIPVTSPATGTIADILVKEGEIVGEGQKIAVVTR